MKQGPDITYSAFPVGTYLYRRGPRVSNMCSLRILYFPFCTSAVAYTVAVGLFLAVGRETTGKIPQGKVRAPENFCFPSNASI